MVIDGKMGFSIWNQLVNKPCTKVMPLNKKRIDRVDFIQTVIIISKKKKKTTRKVDNERQLKYLEESWNMKRSITIFYWTLSSFTSVEVCLLVSIVSMYMAFDYKKCSFDILKSRTNSIIPENGFANAIELSISNFQMHNSNPNWKHEKQNRMRKDLNSVKEAANIWILDYPYCVYNCIFLAFRKCCCWYFPPCVKAYFSLWTSFFISAVVIPLYPNMYLNCHHSLDRNLSLHSLGHRLPTHV